MTTETTKTTNEVQIRELINDWAKTTREGDDDAVLSNHAADVLIFDVLARLCPFLTFENSSQRE